MAFPEIIDADTQQGSQTSNATSWTVTYPTNVVAGDLLVMFVGYDGTGTVNANAAGWLIIENWSNGTGAVRMAALGKVADGSESGTFTLSSSASEQGRWCAMRIPVGTHFGNASVSFNVFGNPTQDEEGTSAAPTGGASLNAGSARDYLWIVGFAWDSTPTWVSDPSGYTYRSYHGTSGGSNGAGLAVSARQLNASSEDPGAGSISASEQWTGAVICVVPATPGVPRFTPYPQLLAH